MSSGQRRVILNTRERLISDDANLAQDFSAWSHHELLRALFNQRGLAGPMRYPGVGAPWPNPLPANYAPHDVINGLMVRPDLANDLLIDPGVVGYINPGSGSTYDSDYQVVFSDGVQSTGVLPFSANGGPGTRIDIIECQPEDYLVDSDSRDIWDPSTQSFTATVVQKIREHRLTFRVATLGQGGGLRPIDSSWIPLAVAFVLPGASGWNDCDIYDVRPLVNERWTVGRQTVHAPRVPTDNGGVIYGAGYAPRYTRLDLGMDALDQQHGYFEAEWAGYIAGGEIRRNCVTSTFGGGDQSVIDLDDSDNNLTNSGAGSGGAAKNLVLGAFFPGDYPRWVRYSQASIGLGRVPQGANGILMVGPESILLNTGALTPVAAANWPSHWGFASGSIPGIHVATVRQWDDNTVKATIGSLNSGFRMPEIEVGGPPVVSGEVAITGIEIIDTVNSYYDATFTGGSGGVPANAKSLIIRGNFSITYATPGSDNVQSIRLYAFRDLAIGGSPGVELLHSFLLTGPPGTNPSFRIVTELPLFRSVHYDEQTGGNVRSYLRTHFQHNSSGVTAINGSWNVIGYKL